MRRRKNIPSLNNERKYDRKNDRKNERGTVIALVAVFMLFVIGAMAALAIDAVTLYTARSEAQLIADSAALAAARVLANSGLTSTGAPAGAEIMATTVATQVATANSVAGGVPTTVAVTFNDGALNFATDPHVTVTVQSSLPTFFARIWGRTQITVSATATAEAYNPSNATGTSASSSPPVAPLCVKPWLLPNLDPTQTSPTGPAIFDATGAIVSSGLVGKTWPLAGGNTNGLFAACGDCSPPPGGSGVPAPSPGQYYPGATDASDFSPTQAAPACSASFNAYQLAVAGCVQQPISCRANANNYNIDVNPYTSINAGGRDADTVQAAECLIHYTNPGDSDSVDTSTSTPPPFEFLGGNQNPIANAINKDVIVSDSLVTIPVINTTSGVAPASQVQVIGFLQVFLNPSATAILPPPGTTPPNQIPAMIVNMAGCGTSATGQPILGNGASPVAVRLISPP